MDFGFTEEQRMLRDSVGKLLQKHATPDYVRKHDRERTYPEELFQAWAEAGLLGLPFPEEYGGSGGSLMDMVIVAEEIARVSADLVMAYTGGIFCGLNVLRKASEEQKRYWLPKFLVGEIKFSISMSEPDAGSDIGAMRYHRGQRRQRMGDRRAKNLGFHRGCQEQCHLPVRKDRHQGALPPGHVAVFGR